MPRVGILHCGEQEQESLDKLGPYENAFKTMLDNCLPDFWNYRIWRCFNNEIPVDVTESDVWIVTGSKHGTYEDIPWIKHISTFIQKLDELQHSRLLGICFGHQLIHQALGGTVVKSEKGWGAGPYPLTMHKAFAGLNIKDTCKLLAIHQDQVTVMAPEFELIAGSDFCPYAITHKGNNILTLQPHPEFEDRDLIYLYQRNRHNIGSKRVDEVLAGMGQPDHREQVRKQICQFLRPARNK